MEDNDAIDNAIEVLNRLHTADPTVLQELIFYRVFCNKAVADDPTIQVGVVGGSNSVYEVGFLGIINGLFGINEDGWGYITANVDDNGRIINFSRTKGTPTDANELARAIES